MVYSFMDDGEYGMNKISSLLPYRKCPDCDDERIFQCLYKCGDCFDVWKRTIERHNKEVHGIESPSLLLAESCKQKDESVIEQAMKVAMDWSRELLDIAGI